MLKYVIITFLFALSACSQNNVPKSSVHEVTGSSKEQVDTVVAMIARHQAPPTAILDAHFVEEQAGDGVLGPSDYRAFYFVAVAPQDVSRWTEMLTPLGEIAKYDAPAQLRDWWVSRDGFSSLRFYKPDILTGRIHGWIGVSQQTGHIYIFTFTM